MSDYLTERILDVSIRYDSSNLISDLEAQIQSDLISGHTPVRFAITDSRDSRWRCDVGVHVGAPIGDSVFRFERRSQEDTSSFNVVMLVPTGIGAEIGGHAGDATPAATLLATVCDTLITHPNVLNAADMIQIPTNALYVEGSVITRLMMGTVRLSRSRSNRVLVLIQQHEDQVFTDAAINAINAARVYYGLRVSEVVGIDPRFAMSAGYSPSGVAAGRIDGLSGIWRSLDSRLGEFDAVAISSVIDAPLAFHLDYYDSAGRMINPWGGVEAMLTHAISLKYGVPTAHSPMLESKEIADLDLGVVDSRMAAEVVSVTFFESVLRGLQQSPRIAVSDSIGAGSIGAEGISCLVIPDGCLGLPTLAALQQGIPVIAVRENRNIMQNRLSDLPWRSDQFIEVDNYWEAAGVVAAMRSGIDPYSIRRPIYGVKESFQKMSAQHTKFADTVQTTE